MKATLITGASGGIGEALANKLAIRKHNLVLVARNTEKLAILCQQLSKQFGIEAHYIAADLSKPEAAELIFTETQKRNLEIETLINNAGIGSGGEFSELPLKGELDMLQLNNASFVAMTHFFLPQMQKRKSGTIINVASMAAFMPVPYMAVYAASKVFVRSFTEAITEECKPHNIHVMLLCPGLTKTNFNQAAGIENEKGKALTEGANLQTPEEVADEALKGLDQKKHVVISGVSNRMAAKMTALFPNAMLAKRMAASYRRKMSV
ncbi:SDR family NAD(P)-dependent oxidoreductase [Spirosoma sp. HMF4905]|uniref:SDR family NAD(P)-dependent oxidoreductase n=1 Tax=Spirosoma arboris TaxID=2682092 RepID=A0A7K1SJY0_9BACT|nr:SDR family oxidoreductase [Spirosoma arboris]MVM34102.1 SDR family NAD(P)-dependent oxidoreductase [Spirosoma arboris]